MLVCIGDELSSAGTLHMNLNVPGIIKYQNYDYVCTYLGMEMAEKEGKQREGEEEGNICINKYTSHK